MPIFFILECFRVLVSAYKRNDCTATAAERKNPKAPYSSLKRHNLIITTNDSAFHVGVVCKRSSKLCSFYIWSLVLYYYIEIECFSNRRNIAKRKSFLLNIVGNRANYCSINSYLYSFSSISIFQYCKLERETGKLHFYYRCSKMRHFNCINPIQTVVQ